MRLDKKWRPFFVLMQLWRSNNTKDTQLPSDILISEYASYMLKYAYHSDFRYIS